MPVDISAAIEKHKQAIDSVASLEKDLYRVIDMITAALTAGQTIFSCGNGGSAADAQHFAAELTGRYESDRRGYSAISLTTDTSALTSIGNDYGFSRIYSRQLEALGKDGDVLIAISTSGNSENIISAVKHAKQHNIKTIGLLGRDGGSLKNMVDIPLVIQAQSTARIQEAHILILHIICDAFEIQK